MDEAVRGKVLHALPPWVNKALVYISQGQYYFLTSTERMLSCQSRLPRPAQDQIRMWTRKSLVARSLCVFGEEEQLPSVCLSELGGEWAEKIRVGHGSCLAKVQFYP